MDELAIEAVLFCDDVRKEDNGKILIIGAYSSSIIVPVLPANLRLSFLIIAHASGPLKTDLEFKVKFGEETKANGKGFVEATSAGRQMLPIPNVTLPNITTAGEIVFECKVGSSDWRQIGRLPLSVRGRASSNASPPPS